MNPEAKDWKSIFTQSVKIDLDVDKEIPGGLPAVLHYQPNTIVKIRLTPEGQAAPATRAATLWQALENAMRVMLRGNLAHEEWEQVASSDYTEYNRKFKDHPPADEDEFIWPTLPEFGTSDLLEPPKNQAVDIFVYGVIELENYVIPITIYTVAREWKERSDYLFDNLNTNADVFYMLFSPTFIRENSGYQLTYMGGLNDHSSWVEKEGAVDHLIGTNLFMVDYWMSHPDLDKYLPRLSSKEVKGK